MDDSPRHDEFVALLEQHRTQLFGYIYALLRNLQDTEDIYQQTCLVLWRKFADYQSDTKFLSWACQTAQFEVRNFLKRKSRQQAYLSEVRQNELAALQSHGSAAHRHEDAVRHCTSRLAERDRDLIQRCYGTDHSFKQVAKDLGRSPKSVYDALSRIRRGLMLCIQRFLAREGD